MDTDSIMKSALLTRVGKDGVLGKDERVKGVVQHFGSVPNVAPKGAGGSSNQEVAGKVEARIRSSKKVAEVMKSVIDNLRNLVLGKEKEKNGIQLDEADEEESEEEDGVDLDTEVNLTGAGADDERSSADGFSDAGWESGSIDDTELKNGEEEGGVDSEWESYSTSSEGKPQPTKKKVKVKTSKDLPQKAPVQAALAPASQAQSTFLPTLAAGYIRGGSSADDQWSDVDAFPKEKKNRRGQRARRAIWEKKYGRHANHVKKKNEEIQAKIKAKAQARANRASGGPDRSASNHRHRAQPFVPPSRTDSGYANRSQQTPGVGAPPQSRGRDEKALHPSWEAKRKAKQKLDGVGAGSVSAGTKIKFD